MSSPGHPTTSPTQSDASPTISTEARPEGRLSAKPLPVGLPAGTLAEPAPEPAGPPADQAAATPRTPLSGLGLRPAAQLVAGRPGAGPAEAGAAGFGPATGGFGPTTERLVRGDSGHGELTLRDRDGILELVVDGVFAMDSSHPQTEIALAELALDRLRARGIRAQDTAEHTAGHAEGDSEGHAARRAAGHGEGDGEGDGAATPGWRVLVGGLGLGFTAAAVAAEPRVGELVVVELQPLLVDWVRNGLVAPAIGLLDDARVQVVVGDVGTVVADQPEGTLDAVLLDVDNGPAFLVHRHNARLYRTAFLTAALRALVPGGVLAIWSADPAPDLLTTLRAAGGVRTEEVLFDVRREGHRLDYAVYLAERPA